MSEYLLSIKIEPLEEGGCLATSDDFPEFLARGRTVAETLEIAQDVVRKIVEPYLNHGDPLPDALKTAMPAAVSLEAKIPISVVAWPNCRVLKGAVPLEQVAGGSFKHTPSSQKPEETYHVNHADQ